MVLQGQKIMMNDALMVIVDLSRVWGEMDIHETDLPYVRTGMPVEVTLSYWAGKVIQGKCQLSQSLSWTRRRAS